MIRNLPQHDCNSILQKVYLCLDGEMSSQEEEIFLADIERCSHCLQHYQIEESFKTFLTSRIERRKMGEDKKRNILASIQASQRR